MKSIERTKLIRALRAITDVPLPQTGIGTVSMSMKGMYDYQNDMREATRHINNIRYALIDKEPINDEDVQALEKIAYREEKGKTLEEVWLATPDEDGYNCETLL